MVFITDPVSSVKHTKYVASDCVMFCSFSFRSSIILFFSVLFVREYSLTVYIYIGWGSQSRYVFKSERSVFKGL